MVTYFLIGFVVGVAAGSAIALIVAHLRARAVRSELRETFSALAGEALDANARRLAEQAGTIMDSKKELVDQAIRAVNERLEQLRTLVQQSEADRREDFGKLTSSVGSLSASAGELHKMLASTQRRGAWGERMAEDVLRLAGLEEGLNYAKQSAEQADTGRPDFTFFLPNDLKANMDVKFPLDRYKTYLDAETDDARAAEQKQLVGAVRNHVRDVAGRGYIDAQAPTVPYVLVFIPSEQLYSLVLEAAPDLMDEALGRKVVLCSPLTLYAMLAVVRQAAENANVMKTADEVLSLLGEFYKQWDKYNEAMDKLGDRIRQTAEQYEAVRSTRSNMLQRPLDKIETLRTSRELPVEAADEP